ncbi:MAG TPA: FkbM family methyltransferase [Kofleriaceae bacterium]|nr:FkbM family methyltransferase [Kofleriaceae bacterium]
MGLRSTPMLRKYRRFPRLMFWLRRVQGVNYEPEMELLDILCDGSATSVDVGAKLGMYSDRLRRHSRDVVAFEPIPHLVEFLRATIGRKGCRIEACALSDAPGKTRMRIPFGSNGEVKLGRSTIEPQNSLTHDDVADVDEIEVELRTLDQHDLRGVGFIKIDVEGHECAVLRGATATLAREQPNLLVEANENHAPNALLELTEITSGLGYQGYFRGDAGLTAMSTVDDRAHYQKAGIENFLFVHASRPEVVANLKARLAPKPS